MTDPIRIIGLKADNVKTLRAIDLTFSDEGALIPVTGANGAGKSSLLDIALWAFGGKGAQDAVPIRQGEDAGKLVIKTSNGLTIRWSFTEKGAYLTVKNAEGFTGNQGLLDRLLGPGGGLDPHEFMLLRPAEQAERLRVLTGVDTRALDEQIKTLFDERADANRAAKQEHARLADCPVPPLDEVDLDPIDTDKLIAQIGDAQKTNADIERQRRECESEERGLNIVLTDLERTEGNIHDTERLIAQMQMELIETKERFDNARAAHLEEKKALISRQAEVNALVEVPMEDIQANLGIASTENAKRVQWREQIEAAERQRLSVIVADARAEDLTARLEAERKARSAMIAGAEMPVEGLAFGPDGVELNGLPFAQASHSEQIDVSLAMAMAMAPDLRVITIKDASLFDEATLERIRARAQDQGYQIFAELVGDAREQGVHIVDGTVTQVDGVPV